MPDHPMLLLIVLPVALFVVVWSAGIFLRGAVSVAQAFRLPEFIVGSVLVAVGTSAPELAINVIGALEEAGDLVVSNILGSNLVNLGLGLGIAGMMISFDRARPEYSRTMLVGLFGAIAVLAITLATARGGQSHMFFWAGFGLLAVFLGFMWSTIRGASGPDPDPDEEIPASVNLWKAVPMILGGAVAMAVFSDVAVVSATKLSLSFGIPEAVIGATVIAAGGSLPEVSSCIAAARIGRPNLILGNIVGSQIFNVLGILGVSVMIHPFVYSSTLAIDAGVLVALTLLAMACLRIATLRRIIGPLLLAGYGGYAAYLVAISV